MIARLVATMVNGSKDEVKNGVTEDEGRLSQYFHNRWSN